MSKSKLRKGFAAVLAISVIVWTFALAVSVNVGKGAAYDVVKAVGDSKLYLVGGDGSTIHYIPDASIFYMYYTGFGAVTINETELSGFTVGNNLSIPAGVLIKAKEGAEHPEVYLAVKSGTKIVLRHVKDMDAFNKFGLQSKNLFRVPYSVLSVYDKGDELTKDSTVADVREMNVVKYAGASDVYLIEGGKKKHIASETAYRENYFGSFARVITIADTETYTDDTAIAGPVDTYKPTIRPTTEVPAPTGSLTVTLASDTPISSTLVAGQALADLAHFTFTASADADVKVTKIKLQRIGVSADATLSAVYLYEGANRLTDSATVSSTYITINNPTGLFTVPAGGSKVVAVKSNIAGSTSGETVGVQVVAAADVASNAASVAGSFPVKGNLHSIASATLATVTLGTTTPAANTSVQPGETNFSVWKNTVSVATRDVTLNYLTLREIGSIQPSDLQNLTLYVDGVKVGVPQTQLDSNYYVTFDLSASPVTLKTGSRTIEVKADIIGGSSKNYTLSLRYVADIILVDSQYKANITIAGTVPATCGTQTVATGSLTVTKKQDSPSSNVTKDAPSVTLASYELKAYGESVKVESLRVAYASSDSAIGKLRNGALFADGVQVGSTTDLQNASSTPAYTSYTLGSSLIVKPGTPVTLEVKADIFDNDGTNSVDANDTITVRIVGGDLDNAQAQTSLTTLDIPSANVAANTVTIVTGSLSLAADRSYANQNTISGQTAYKIGDYVLGAAQGEDVDLSTFTVAITYTDTTGDGDTAATILSNLYVKYADKTTTPKSSAAASNSFSVTHRLTNNTQIPVEIYADINSSADATDTIATSLAISANTTQSSTNADVTAVTGQTITLASGSLTVAVDGATPVTSLVIANTSDVKVATYKFTAQNAKITVKDMTMKLVTAASDRTVQGAKLDVDNDGKADTALVSFSRIGGVPYAAFPGLNFTVDTGKTQKINVLLSLNDVTINGTSGDDVQVNLYSYKYAIPGSADTTVTPSALNGNNMIVRNTKPTITKVSSSGALLNGTEMDIYQFKVAADSNADVAIKQMKFAVTITDNVGTNNTLTIGGFKLYRGSVNLTDNVFITDASSTPANLETGGSSLAEGSSTVVIRWNSEEVVEKAGTPITYTIKATPSGFATNADDDNFTIQMSGDASAATSGNVYLVDTDATTNEYITGLGTVNQSASEAANFIWSDNAAIAHASTLVDNTGAAYTATSTTDWTNSYLLKDDIPGSAVQFTF